ncbi:histone deacetylase HosB [Metarhizium guizhouense ARSEF 977]|uniref:Histone deacetylase HosB n=1 Tax=Metarhizium guizhouense (strain ARSEF 977) TaxID=1276136 RepID=A0A0B4GM14_METGA|nr:histone deacetylase HosB [Metarhizium guizhouense ARSEF 977]
MSHSIHGSLSPRQGPTSPASNRANDDNSGLTQSLSQLSLTNEPKTLKPLPSPRNSWGTPAKPPPRRSSSASPHPRTPSRSPSNGPGSRRASHAETPPLLRKASMNSLHSANGVAPGRPLARRSSSSHIISTSPANRTPPEEKPPLTARSIASDYFAAELAEHHGATATLPTDTVVILNDAVYGHRFSRPRTSRSALSTIVERPERIKAAVLGISTAYVRLGGRHCQGHLPIHPKRNLSDINSIPFRIHKTTRQLSLLSSAVTNVHGTKWMEELKLMCGSAESILAMGGKELQRPDISRGPEHPAPQKLHEGDLYLCEESLNAMQGALGAVCEAVDTVFGSGPRKAFVGVRPPGHHCSASHPSGFCWVNNVHVGIMHAALQHGLTHAAIIDFDLHHGDGSQAITWQHNARANAANKSHASWKRTSIGYFSLHDINSYPCEMGDEDKVKNASLCIDSAHGQSIWNIHLQSWKTEQEFWTLYESTYAILLEKTRRYLKNEAAKLRASNQVPKAAVFFSAGFDASEWESAGMQRHHVNVPTEFYARLSQDVVRLAAEEGLAVDGRVISVLEGGYSDRALCSGIMSHLSGLVGGSHDMEQSPIKTEQESSGLAYEMGQRIGAINLNADPIMKPPASMYDPAWWATNELDLLEEPEEPLAVPKKPRNSTPPTYSSPTQASTARVADPIKMKNSLSGLSTSYSKVPQRPTSPPPPEVPWHIAAKELCKTLIPSDRQTDSCTAEDLNAEASRARRDRQSLLLGNQPPTPSGSDRSLSRMSLRERKSRPIGPIDEEMSEVLPKTRRKPASTPISSPAKAGRSTPRPAGAQSARKSSRRLSVASTNLSPPREEPPPVPPIPATAPVPSRTASRPNSRTGRTQSSNKVPAKKTQAVPPRIDPAPKGGRNVARASTPAKGAKQSTIAADTPTPATGLPLNAVGNDAKSDIDSLTDGVKKIRINLITKAQRDGKQKAKSEQGVEPHRQLGQDSSIVKSEKPPTPEGMSSIPNAPEQLPTQLAPASGLPEAPPTPSLSGGISTPVEEMYTSNTSSPTPTPSIPTGSSPDVPHVTIQPASDASDVFIPYQPEGPEPVTMVQHEHLKWLPPNIQTPSSVTPVHTPLPSAAKTKNSLFHYTSGIRFAPRPDTELQGRPGSVDKPRTGHEQ